MPVLVFDKQFKSTKMMPSDKQKRHERVRDSLKMIKGYFPIPTKSQVHRTRPNRLNVMNFSKWLTGEDPVSSLCEEEKRSEPDHAMPDQ